MSRTKSDTYDNIQQQQYELHTPERKSKKQYKYSDQLQYKLCSPLPLKDGINPQNYSILTTTPNNNKNNKINLIQNNNHIHLSCQQSYSSSSTTTTNSYLQSNNSFIQMKQIRFSLDVNDENNININNNKCDYSIFTNIEPFLFNDKNYSISLNSNSHSNSDESIFEQEKQDQLSRLRKDSLNPHGKDLDMLEEFISQQQQQHQQEQQNQQQQQQQYQIEQLQNIDEQQNELFNLGFYPQISNDICKIKNIDPNIVMQEIENAWLSLETTSSSSPSYSSTQSNQSSNNQNIIPNSIHS